MLDSYVGSKDESEVEENGDVETEFARSMLGLGARLADENLRRLQLLENKRRLEKTHMKPTDRLHSLLKEFDGLSQEMIETLEKIGVQDPPRKNTALHRKHARQ